MNKFLVSLNVGLIGLLSNPLVAEASNHCNKSGKWCWKSFAMVVAWILVTSALVFFTWNKVFVNLFKMKKAKFWQALLVILTICAFCLPKHYGNKCGSNCGGGSCGSKKGGCEYTHKDR